ncbi:MAG: recombinase family protein [Aeriscardovia sp.]|nr:recombinase family protein [Aeriscardovia sp.]
MNVAGYARVSSEGQLDGYSIPQQKDIIENYCKIKDWNLVKIYVDGGFTGANTERPALQDLIDHLDCYDLVLVYKLDRLSRSQRDTLALVDLFDEHAVKFASIQENFDTSTPLGMAMLGILSVFAQLERENIKERMSLGRRGRTKKGLWRAGSNVPTGYDYIDGHLVIREDEAEQIRKIFELYLQGWTINKIRQYMHANYTNRYSSWAQASAISTVLRNQLYIGMLPSKTEKKVYKGEHEAIIDKKTFDKVQRLLEARAEHFDEIQKHPFVAKHLLTGFTYCGECGGRVSCVGTHKYSYYGCHRNTADPRQKALPKCKTPNYNTRILDQLIIDQVMELSYDEKAIKELIKPRKVANHKKAIKSLENQKSRLIDLYSVGGIELEDLQVRINAISEKLLKLKNDKPTPPELSFEDALQLFNDCSRIFSGSDVQKKRVYLQSLIKKIVLSGDEVQIYWRFE